MAEHRVPVLSGSLHRYVDPARSNDPRIRELVHALGTLQVAAQPRAHFRAELRSQLVAVAPRLVAEGPAEPVRAAPPRDPAAVRTVPSRLRELTARIPHLRLGRQVRIVAAALTVVALALSGAVWLSRSALPGDPLYGLKRASENAQFALTTGNVARGTELLSFARTRSDEVSELLSHSTASGGGAQAGGAIDASTASLVRSTLDSADEDVRQAAQLLGSQAVQDKSAAPLSVMTNWAPGQLSRLGDVVARIPDGAMHQRAASSAALVSGAATRAQTLRGELGCSCLDSTRTDPLGPVPCQGCQQPSPAVPVQSTTQPAPIPATTDHVIPRHTDGIGARSSDDPGGTDGAVPPDPTGSAAPDQDGTQSTSPGGTLPSLPSVPLPSLSVPPLPSLTVDSCGAGITLGPISIGLGPCGIHGKI